jgi:hypothetical protein
MLVVSRIAEEEIRDGVGGVRFSDADDDREVRNEERRASGAAGLLLQSLGPCRRKSRNSCTSWVGLRGPRRSTIYNILWRCSLFSVRRKKTSSCKFVKAAGSSAARSSAAGSSAASLLLCLVAGDRLREMTGSGFVLGID